MHIFGLEGSAALSFLEFTWCEHSLCSPSVIGAQCLTVCGGHAPDPFAEIWLLSFWQRFSKPRNPQSAAQHHPPTSFYSILVDPHLSR